MKRNTLLNKYRETTSMLDSLAKIANAQTKDDAWHELERLSHSLSFSYCGVGVNNGRSRDVSLSMEYASPIFSRSFAEYAERNLQMYDPTARALAAGASHTFPIDGLKNASGRLHQGARELMSFLNSYNISSHGALRMELPNGRGLGFLGLGMIDGTDYNHFKARFKEHLQVLRLATICYTNVMVDADKPSAKTILSPRESHVLTLLAQGLSPAEIAENDNRSIATIRQQIISARSRLGARTTAQAVAIAQSMGVIQ